MRDTELTIIRNAALVSAYHSALDRLGSNAPFASKKAVIRSIITSSAPRFYCSFEEASRICSLVIRGMGTGRAGVRGKLYTDLSKIVNEKLSESNMHTMRLAIMQAIESPAPQWYIGIDSAIRVINRSYKRRGTHQ